MRRSTIAYIATIVCIILSFFLIASTIVVSIIPAYIHSKAVAANPDVSKSKDIVMSIEVEENHSVALGRRRRAAGDLYEFIGGQFGSADIQKFKLKLRALLSSYKTVSDIVITSISLGYEPTKRRRRLALSKRDTYPSHSIVLVVNFYIIYASTCLYKCQSNVSPTLRTSLYDTSSSTLDITDVSIYKNNTFYKIAPSILFIKVVYVSLIIPGTIGSTQEISTVTVTLATTTVASVTSLIGG